MGNGQYLFPAHQAELARSFPSRSTNVRQGAVESFYVQPIDYISNSHGVDGSENVALRMTTPSGIPVNVPLELDGDRFAAPVSDDNVTPVDPAGSHRVIGVMITSHPWIPQGDRCDDNVTPVDPTG
eukprot:1192047-Prorocentrum_minimum.AAC.6